MSWFYLALLAPMIYAVVNLLDDNLVRHVYKGAHAGAIISGCFGIVPATLILLTGRTGALPADLVIYSTAAGVLTVLGYYFYFTSLENENPSVVAALFSVTPAAIPFIAYFLVGERLSVGAAVGFIILIVAALVYSLSDVKKLTISKALIPAILASAALDVVSLTSEYVYTRADFYQAFYFYSLGLVIGGLYFLAVSILGHTRTSIGALLGRNSIKTLLLLSLVEAVGITAEFVHSKALSLGPVSIVEVLQNLQPLYIVLISIALFPFYPQYFRDTQPVDRKIKFAMLLMMLVGAYLASW